MRSATSYFNGTLYRKTLARFWPLWGLWGVIWLFFIPLNFLNTYFNRYMSTEPRRRLLINALNLPEYATLGLFLAAFFAILCAMAVFGYLYNHRSACWFHALPMRREALFTTQYLAGLSFLLLPLLAVAVLTAVVEVSFLPMDRWGAVLAALGAWLLATSGICLFFFSFAAFCAMFTGHILALPAFYCILNVLADVLYTLIDALMHQFFFGYTGSPGAYRIVEYLTPAYALKDAVVLFGSDDKGHYFHSPETVAAYAAVGVLLAFVSLYVYRRRHVETAGDVVAVAIVRPVFQYGVSFCSGLCLGMFTVLFFGWSDTMTVLIPCILVWAVIGYFAAEMLLKKSFRVFKAWKGAAGAVAALLVICVVCYLDLFGVVGRVPDAGKVESVQVNIDMGYPGDDGQGLNVTLTDPENIQKFVDLHRAIVADRDRLNEESRNYKAGNDYTHLRLEYTLKGGSALNRRYSSIPLYREDIDREGSVANLVKGLYEDRDLVAQAYGFDSFLKDARLTGAWLDRITNASGDTEYDVYVDDYAQELWDAVQQDFAEGTIGVRYLFDRDGDRLKNTYRTDLTFSNSSLRDPDVDYSSVETSPGGYIISSTLTVTLTPNARHTLVVLEQTGIYEEGYSLAAYEPDYDPQYPDTDAQGGWEVVY